jgi:7-cyano-7-deazaguanine synthase in queuosine biosynthesis
MKKAKKVLVLWSGGLDSTYVVYKNLKDGNGVLPVYGEIVNNEDKTLIEKQQVEILHKLFREDYDYSYLSNIVFNCKIEILGSNHLDLLQLPIWLTTILYSQYLKEADEVHIGYVCNDDAASYIEDIKKIYNSFAPLYSFKLPKLVFPIIKYKKEHIINLLPKKYLKQTSSCETPEILNKKEIKEKEKIVKYKLCGTCHPCKRRKELGVDDVFMYIEIPEKKSIGDVYEKDSAKLLSNSSDKQLSLFDVKDDMELTEEAVELLADVEDEYLKKQAAAKLLIER